MNAYPATTEQRRAGMAAMRAQALASKLRALEAGVAHLASGRIRKLTAAERAAIEDDVATIRAAQVRFGEVRA